MEIFKVKAGDGIHGKCLEYAIEHDAVIVCNDPEKEDFLKLDPNVTDKVEFIDYMGWHDKHECEYYKKKYIFFNPTFINELTAIFMQDER